MTIRPPEDNREHALAMVVEDVRCQLERAQFYISHSLDLIHYGEIGKELALALRTASAFFKSGLETYNDLKKRERQ